MNYAVDWDDLAIDGLATVLTLVAAADRAAVNAAADRIDALLAVDPVTVADSHAEGLYALDVPPLRAMYEVDPIARLVSVVRVNWLTATP